MSYNAYNLSEEERLGRNWWVWDRGDIYTLMCNDYYIATISRSDVLHFATDFSIKIVKFNMPSKETEEMEEV